MPHWGNAVPNITTVNSQLKWISPLPVGHDLLKKQLLERGRTRSASPLEFRRTYGTSTTITCLFSKTALRSQKRLTKSQFNSLSCFLWLKLLKASASHLPLATYLTAGHSIFRSLKLQHSQLLFLHYSQAPQTVRRSHLGSQHLALQVSGHTLLVLLEALLLWLCLTCCSFCITFPVLIFMEAQNLALFHRLCTAQALHLLCSSHTGPSLLL